MSDRLAALRSFAAAAARARTLDRAERRALVEAVLLQGLFAGALRLLPPARVNRLLRRPVPAPRSWDGRAARAAWAVAAAGHHLGSACLTQALAARVLLERQAVRCTLHVGVANTDGRFEAHAWLEHAGRVVVGGAADRFAVIWAGE